MTKREIFQQILTSSAFVCDVEEEEILNGCRKQDVVTARSICIFWADAAGFSVESLVKCMDSNYANSINSVKARQEEMWRDKFAYHMLVIDAGKRLLKIAHDIGEDFDVDAPIEHLAKITGKYMPTKRLKDSAL